MSKVEVISLESLPQDLFAALTAEAWMDPELAQSLISDKHATICRFAREHGYAAPEPKATEQFELPQNPVGELVMVELAPAVWADQTAGCATTQNSCNCVTTPCSSQCVTTPCSTQCPTTGCSAQCVTAQCSAQCPTATMGC